MKLLKKKKKIGHQRYGGYFAQAQGRILVIYFFLICLPLVWMFTITRDYLHNKGKAGTLQHPWYFQLLSYLPPLTPAFPSGQALPSLPSPTHQVSSGSHCPRPLPLSLPSPANPSRGSQRDPDGPPICPWHSPMCSSPRAAPSLRGSVISGTARLFLTVCTSLCSSTASPAERVPGPDHVLPLHPPLLPHSPPNPLY